MSLNLISDADRKKYENKSFGDRNVIMQARAATAMRAAQAKAAMRRR